MLRSKNKFLARLLSIVAELGNVYEEVNKKTKNKDFSTNGASEIMCISKLNINKKNVRYLFNISRHQSSDLCNLLFHLAKLIKC